jgi:hypothetical protein
MARMLSTFSAFFACEPVDDGIFVTRSVTISLPVALRPLERLTLGRQLQTSVERELDLTRRVFTR